MPDQPAHDLFRTMGGHVFHALDTVANPWGWGRDENYSYADRLQAVCGYGDYASLCQVADAPGTPTCVRCCRSVEKGARP